MRIMFSVAIVLFVATSSAVRAEDPPEGAIGVQLKLEDGKVVVALPVEGSPAAKAGFKTGDVILKVNDYKVKENAEEDDLHATVKEVGKYKPGEKVKVGIKREGKDMTIEVTVGKRSEVFPPKDKD
jgi:C-terminal processing protease CtpA/Prc